MRKTGAIVWSIAGSDSSGRAGIQADLKTLQCLGVHGCSVITAVTSQSHEQLSDIQFIDIDPQLQIMRDAFQPDAIKIGMLGKQSIIQSVLNVIKTYSGKVILDPVMVTTTGGNLFSEEVNQYANHLKTLFKYVDVLTPNIPEAEMLLNRRITSFQDIEQAARDLLLLGVKSVLIKGGHFKEDTLSQDYWTNGVESFWLASHRHLARNFSGTGCVFSSAIAAACALGFDVKDALVIAKMYVNQSMRCTDNEVLRHIEWPQNDTDLPFLTDRPLWHSPLQFPDCGPEMIGLYPIVDSLAWLKLLLPLGIKSIQLRIKNKSGPTLENEISQSIMLAKQYDTRLFINDAWQLAIKYGAYGVHLGQDDLKFADVEKIHAAGLRLGISTHCYVELARAHSFRPSYIAFGPIFETTSKPMMFSPQGIDKLHHWCRMLNYPVVAIGGIHGGTLPSVLETNVNGIALISAITNAADPVMAAKNLLKMVG